MDKSAFLINLQHFSVLDNSIYNNGTQCTLCENSSLYILSIVMDEVVLCRFFFFFGGGGGLGFTILFLT